MGNFYSSEVPKMTLDSMKTWKGEQRKEIFNYISEDIWLPNILEFIGTMESDGITQIFKDYPECSKTYLSNMICECLNCDNYGFPCDNCRSFFVKETDDDLPGLECSACNQLCNKEGVCEDCQEDIFYYDEIPLDIDQTKLVSIMAHAIEKYKQKHPNTDINEEFVGEKLDTWLNHSANRNDKFDHLISDFDGFVEQVYLMIKCNDETS